MILFITTPWHGNSVKSLIDGSYGFELPVCQWISYDNLFQLQSGPVATYIFTDLERLSPWELSLASSLFDFLTGKGLRCLNNPARVRTRVELLRLLAEKEISNVGVWRADERPRPGRFPVFIRGENDHAKPWSGLIENQRDLDRQLDDIRAAGNSLRGLILLEFQPGPYNEKLWHKWGTFRVGDLVSVDHIAVDDNWLVKYGDYSHLDESIIRDEHDAVLSNRFADEMMGCFELAAIEYGRADHAYADGQLVVYEINTNPFIGHYVPGRHALSLEKQQRARERLASGFYAIDTQDSGTIPFDVDDRHFRRIRRNSPGTPFWRP
jgi:hypothetical protein